MRNRRGGCSALLLLLLLLCLAAAFFYWPTYLDSRGEQTAGVLAEKQESVYVHAGDWYRRLQIVASFSIPGQNPEHRASCDVDEKTYDSLRVGGSVPVHYVANLLSQSFLPATHLSPCTSLASINWNPSVTRILALAAGTFLIIFFLRRVLRIRLAGLLYVLWIGLFFSWFAIPRVEPVPSHPQSATATIEHITTISTLLTGSERRGIGLKQPYQIVQLKFTPNGMDAPVIAVDKIDPNSVPNLQEGQSVSISYDAAHPRIARVQGGTRLFPRFAFMSVILLAAILMLIVFVFFIVSWVRHVFRRNPATHPARLNADTVRRFRRGL